MCAPASPGTWRSGSAESQLYQKLKAPKVMPATERSANMRGAIRQNKLRGTLGATVITDAMILKDMHVYASLL